MNKRVPQSNLQSEARPRFDTHNPATGQSGRTYEGRTQAEVRDIVVAVDRAFAKWRRRSYSERAGVMKKAAAVLRQRKDEFAALMMEEMGKPISDGRAEVEKCATACDYFADNAERFLAQEKVDLGGPEAFISFEPLGVILAIMPWNFPFWQVFRFAAPTLMAGNVAVLKHASNVPGCALAIETVFREAGFPDDVFRTLLIPSRDVDAVIDMKEVKAVTLTGSVEAGRKVAAAAAQRLKKSVLELGGSDAYVVLEDADIAKAAKICATARMVNAGQSCIAGKRFIVVEKVLHQFEKAFVAAMKAYEMGDPRDEGTKFGPMYSIAGRDELHEQVKRSIAAGARVLTGGEKPQKPGAWYPPTVLTDVKSGVPAFEEEIFGPVASVIVANDERDAIAIANDSEFGLGSAVITRDLDRGRRIAAHELESGMSFVNDNVRSDARMPFGGLKHSGYGREVSRYGLLEFVNIKSVLVTPMA
ncbi:MAG TPA: NAD-dependent succinate-semialdehyde dehydrogenase [Beijerinckiaceae bacterium]|nr:NAD-dependent succinate-semialdehyde dehydrogenase [Beijerinckiaceae bacterium]